MTPRQIIARRTAALGFDMASDESTGALLSTLVASKPCGRILELGTGTGLATVSLLEGMDDDSRLISVDNNLTCQTVARDVLANDHRVAFALCDGLSFLSAQKPQTFDLVFADAWPGKYEGLNEALALVAPGGFFICDDMQPRGSWPEGHAAKATALIECLSAKSGWHSLSLELGSGFLIAVKT